MGVGIIFLLFYMLDEKILFLPFQEFVRISIRAQEFLKRKIYKERNLDDNIY